MTVQEWLYSKETVKRSMRSYAHFDLRTDLSHKRNYISSPEKLLSMVFTLSYITKLKQQYSIVLRELKIKNGISVMRLTLIGVFINTTVFC